MILRLLSSGGSSINLASNIKQIFKLINLFIESSVFWWFQGKNKLIYSLKFIWHEIRNLTTIFKDSLPGLTQFLAKPFKNYEKSFFHPFLFWLFWSWRKFLIKDILLFWNSEIAVDCDRVTPLKKLTKVGSWDLWGSLV